MRRKRAVAESGKFRTLWQSEDERKQIRARTILANTTVSTVYQWWAENPFCPPTVIEYEGELRRIYGLRDIGGDLFSAVLRGLDAAVVVRGDTLVFEGREGKSVNLDGY